jgi:hypothetical protein
MGMENALCWFVFSFIRFLFYVLGLIISPYSFEIGFIILGSIVVPFAWCYFWKLGISILVFSCYHFNGELPLHVVWLLWNIIPSSVNWFVLMLVVIRLYCDFRDWLLVVARSGGRLCWLGVGPF